MEDVLDDLDDDLNIFGGNSEDDYRALAKYDACIFSFIKDVLYCIVDAIMFCRAGCSSTIPQYDRYHSCRLKTGSDSTCLVVLFHMTFNLRNAVQKGTRQL